MWAYLLHSLPAVLPVVWVCNFWLPPPPSASCNETGKKDKTRIRHTVIYLQTQNKIGNEPIPPHPGSVITLMVLIYYWTRCSASRERREKESLIEAPIAKNPVGLLRGVFIRNANLSSFSMRVCVYVSCIYTPFWYHSHGTHHSVIALTVLVSDPAVERGQRHVAQCVRRVRIRPEWRRPGGKWISIKWRYR